LWKEVGRIERKKKRQQRLGELEGWRRQQRGRLVLSRCGKFLRGGWFE